MIPKHALPLLVLAACGGPKQGPDGGTIDTSCGIDCAAQTRYGLLVNRCFEYSLAPTADNPADLGVLILPVFTLEGGVPAMQAQYTQSGLVKMTDSFVLTGGDLRLARREWGPGSSVTYQDASGAIAGATWLHGGFTDQIVTSVSAKVLAAQTHTDPTQYTVTLSNTPATVPAGTFDAGVQLLVSESPDHGSDPRRVFADGVGFLSIATYFNPTPTGTAQAFNLQKVRDLNPDGGSTTCGLGGP